MRRAPAELGPLTRSGVLAVFLLLVGARPANAQSADAPDDRRAVVAAELTATRLAGASVPMAGGALSFRLTRRLEVEALARAGLTEPQITRRGASVRLRFGYAGARVSFLPAPARFPGSRIAVLLGGGNADAEDVAVGGLLDSDNGVVVEPALSYRHPLRPEVAVTAALAWRHATGFTLLGGSIRSRDLRGPSLGVGVAIGPF